ncbi:hypothetical protein MAQ5080_01986 [Marinomonas aquimarina]|uniref:Uncharacterized protein n=1 Tax=Marinomonas aquimarina TaxID=295068 RepID=A0A1A8TE26_9GAMM|nr:hypothetical protein [Marinomonas aquimarina]SBS31478.1 hypothetical protein MAQ5080_01986 [Marinomonas aquimarina]
MTALIVVFITLSLMGSALWVMPSKREREKMALRMLARKHGINVQLTQVALPDKWDKVTHKVSVCGYRKYHEKPLKEFADLNLYPYEVWKHDSICKGWYASRPFDLPESLAKLLEKHHGAFEAIEVAPQGVSLFWRERGDEAVVDDANAIIDALLQVR